MHLTKPEHHIALSELPPGLSRKVQELSDEDAKIKLQEFVGKVEVAQATVAKTARNIARKYQEGQSAHYDRWLQAARTLIEA